MSQRHRSAEVAPPPKMEQRAHARGERNRINSALSAVTMEVRAGSEPEDVHEPGPSWVAAHHHDAQRARPDGRKRHWKLKMWKRRTRLRMARAQATLLAARQA